MSAAAAVAEAVPPPKGKKKLIIIIAAALLVLLLGGGSAVFFLKKKAPAADTEQVEGEDAAEAEPEAENDADAVAEEKRKERSKNPPTFVPLEPFVVNLADKEADRFAQIGVTLEVEDAKFAEELKAYMPAIRNGILMVLAHKTSQQLLKREGKIALAREIMREAVLPLGIQVSTEAPEAAPAGEEEATDEPDAPKSPKAAKSGMHNPVTHVHFSNFIVQ